MLCVYERGIKRKIPLLPGIKLCPSSLQLTVLLPGSKLHSQNIKEILGVFGFEFI
jgi:hypothetical protein